MNVDDELSLPVSPEASHGQPDAMHAREDPSGLVEEAFVSHAEALYRIAMAECRDAELARDAVQEAFLRLFRHASDGRPVRRVRAWLTRVLLNVIRDEARRSLREARMAGLLAPAETPVLAPAPQGLEERMAERLSARERQCVELRLLGYRYEEIAEALGIQTGTVGCLLWRAMRKLEPMFSDRAEP